MKRYYDDYSDNYDSYGSDEDENEVPVCFCGKDAIRRISFTDKNPGRPFFNCYKRRGKQCDFFVWEDEFYSDDEGSDDESSYVCDNCLEEQPRGDEIVEFETDQDKERINDTQLELLDLSDDEDESACCKCLKLKRRNDEIESAKEDWDREKLELLAKLEAVESELRHVKKKAKLASEAEDDQSLPFEKLANSGDGIVETGFSEVGKKYELANEANDTPPFEKLSSSEDETLESDLGHLIAKTKLAIETDENKPLMFEKLSDSNEKVFEFEVGQIGKKYEPANEAAYMPPFENGSNSEDETLESDLGQLIAKSKLAIGTDGDELLLSVMFSNSNDGTVESELGQIEKISNLATAVNDVPPFEKLPNSDDEIGEPEVGQAKKKSKVAEADDMPPFEKLSNSKADKAVESELGQIKKKTILANKAYYYLPQFAKLSNSEKVTEGEEIKAKVQK